MQVIIALVTLLRAVIMREQVLGEHLSWLFQVQTFTPGLMVLQQDPVFAGSSQLGVEGEDRE